MKRYFFLFLVVTTAGACSSPEPVKPKPNPFYEVGDMYLTCKKRDEIRSTIAWIQAHLQRGDKAPNPAIASEHDRLVKDKYMHELANHFGCILVAKKG